MVYFKRSTSAPIISSTFFPSLKKWSLGCSKCQRPKKEDDEICKCFCKNASNRNGVSCIMDSWAYEGKAGIDFLDKK